MSADRGSFLPTLIEFCTNFLVEAPHTLGAQSVELLRGSFNLLPKPWITSPFALGGWIDRPRVYMSSMELTTPLGCSQKPLEDKLLVTWMGPQGGTATSARSKRQR